MKKSIFYFLGLFSILLITSCSKEIKKTTLKEGMWRGELTMQNKQLPFNFEVIKNDSTYKIKLINGEETIPLDSVVIKNDSVTIPLYVFDMTLKAKINDTILTGTYTKNYVPNYVLPFKAVYGKNNRVDSLYSSDKFNGKWEIKFTEKNGDTTSGIGIFQKKLNKLTGTILTTTGDYRYLEGTATDSTFTLYSFDGNHCYVFEGNLANETTIKGQFWSGKTYFANFVGNKNDKAELPDADKLTYLKKGYTKMEFTFPDLTGKKVSLSDDKYKNKVVILQILGTWCPNCMDETRFLTQWYDANKTKDVAIIGLAYEAKDDFNYAKTRVENMKKRMHVDYDLLIAGTYTKDPGKTLPMLNHLMSFPTTIIIDKKGVVRKIHTGFSGPATGDYYLKYKEEFNQYIDKLLKEH